MNTSVILSDSGKFRYELRHVWDESKPLVLFICFNPSDDNKAGKTSKKCINYARSWGFGGVLMANLYAYISTEPIMVVQDMDLDVYDPIGPDNDSNILRLCDEASLVVCAWGRPVPTSWFLGRRRHVESMLKKAYCLKKISSGQPGHPLYKKTSIGLNDLVEYIF